MDPEVGLHSPAQLLTLRDLLEKVLPGICLILLLLERHPQVAHILCSAQLWDAREQHEGEKSHQQTRVGAQGEVCFCAGVLMWVLEARKDRIIKKSKDKTIRTAEVEIFSIILKVVSKIRIRLLLISVCVYFWNKLNWHKSKVLIMAGQQGEKPLLLNQNTAACLQFHKACMDKPEVRIIFLD